MFATPTPSDEPSSDAHSRTPSTNRPVDVLRRLLLPVAALLLAGVMLVGCDSTAMEDEEEPAVLRVQTSGDLQQLLAQDTSDFAWDVVAEEIEVIGELTGQDPDRDCLSVQMASIRLVGSESGAPDVVGTEVTEPVTVPVDRLADGMKTTQLYSAPGLRPLVPEDQFPSGTFFPIPSNQFIEEGDPVDAREAPGGVPFYDEALGRDLAADEAAVVIHAFAPGGVPLYDQIQPLGIFLQRESQ
jgi:hypothetical protein